MSEVLHALRSRYATLADLYERIEAAGAPIIDLGKQLIAAREELQAATVDIEFVPLAPVKLCICQPEQLGDGPCPVCGYEMCPF